MKWLICSSVLICCLASPSFSPAAAAQSAAGYQGLIQQGKAQLQAHNAVKALAAGEQAIKLDPKNWEGYALAGGALMNLKRYDDAISRLTDAIERAPQDKQAGLSELRKQCFAAESGSPPPASIPPTPAASPSTPEATTTQAEIVLWKSIEDSTNTADFQSYLSQYPYGTFAILANRRIEDLKIAAAKASEKQQEEAEKLAEFKRRHIPIILNYGAGWVNRPDYGYLEITKDGGKYIGSEKNYQFSKADVSEAKLWCFNGVCGLQMRLKGGDKPIFFAAVEDAVINKTTKGRVFRPPSIIGDQIINQWGWKLGPQNKSVVPSAGN